MRLIQIIALCAACHTAALAQNKVVVIDPGSSEVSEKQSIYQETLDQWMKAGASLERDLQSGDKADLLKRIKAASALEEQLARRKADYYAAATRAYQQQIAKLADVKQGDTAQFRQLIKAQVKNLFDEDSELEKRIKAIGNGADQGRQLLKRHLEDQRKSLSNIQFQWSKLQSSLEEAGAGAQNLDDSLRSLRESVGRLADIYKLQADGAERQVEGSRQYYLALQAQVQTRPDAPAPAKTVASVRPASTPAPAPAPAAAQPAVQPETSPAKESPQQPRPAIQGVWVLRNDDAKQNEPVFIQLTVIEQNGEFSGTLSARIRPGRRGQDPNVAFSFAGQDLSALSWKAPDGNTGTLTLSLQDDGTLFHRWDVDAQTKSRRPSWEWAQATLTRSTGQTF